MIIIRPDEVDQSRLTSSNVPVEDYPEWSAGTYATGDRVVYGIEAYESLTDDNTDQPDTGAAKTTPTWLRLGYVNRWRMFRDGRDSKTRQDNSITVTLDLNRVTTGIALLGLEGLTATVTMTDPIEGVVFERELTITDAAVGNWWDYYFLPYDVREDFVILDLPPYASATITVTVSGETETDTTAIGRYVMGLNRELGTTDHGTRTRWLDSSTRKRDGFGNLTIVPRRRVKLVDYDVSIPTSRVDFVNRELNMLANQPTVFIGDESFSSTIVFGLYRDFDIVISNPALSQASVEVEGY